MGIRRSRRRMVSPALWTVIAAILMSVPMVAQGPKTLNVTKTEAAPSIDGALDDPCWKDAAKGDGFFQRSIGKSAVEPTEFYVCYDDIGIYFGFYCRDSQPDKIKGTQTERDSDLGIDDCVRVYLDAYHDHRTADQFIVNVLGTQRDERTRGTADKIAWKGDWHAAAKRGTDGWTAEMYIPWSILNYKPGATTMGLNVSREQQRLGEVSDWNALNGGGQVMLYGDLAGMVLPSPPKRAMQFMPYLLRSVSVGGGKIGKMGVDMKRTFGEDNTLLLTAFPDFGTIENAVKSIDFSYTAHRYSDNRPFFQEASNIFSSSYMYTTGIPDFDYGAKVFGRRGPITYGLMGCTSLGDRMDTMGVLRYDFAGLTRATLVAVGRDDDEVNNQVMSLKLSGQPSESTSWYTRVARSLTADAEQDGTDLMMGFDYSSSRWSCDASYGHVSRYFNPANGYVDYPASSACDFGLSYEVEQPGQKVRSWYFDSGLDRRWDAEHGTIEASNDVGLGMSFANHSSCGVSYYWGPHIVGYEGADEDPEEPGEYYWVKDSGYSLYYDFNENDQYRSGGLSYNWGRTGGGPSRSIRFNCGFLPAKKLSTSVSMRLVRRDNPIEGKVKAWIGILGARYEFTPEKSVAARVLYRKEGANLTFSYRQRVRQGLDIFALFGDYNADHTVNRLSIKLVAAQ